ncbi:MAG: type IX secretion system membrane protein PorP/SprF [Bacteroidia bacterium]
MKSIFLIAFSLFTFSLFSQEINTIDFNNSLLFTNPAYAGSNGGLRIQSIYLINPKPNNYYKNLRHNSVDGYISKLKMGVFVTETGFNSEYTNTNTKLSTGVTKKLILKNGLTFIPAISGTYLNGNYKYFGYCATPPIATNSTVKLNEFAVNSALIINYKNFYGGVSFNNMFTEKYSNKTCFLKEQTNAHLAYTFNVNDKNLIQISTVFYKQNNFNCLQIGTNAIIHKYFLIGFGYNNNSEIMSKIGFRTTLFSLNYNLNYGFSKLSDLNYNQHSVTASFNLKSKNNRKNLSLIEEF